MVAEHRFIKKKSPPGHIAGLDGLRAFAIIGVTLFHFFPNGAKGGYLGVVLFFVLTGYLLAVTTARQDARGDFHVGKYYLKRIKRIYPELIIVVLFTLGTLCFFAPSALKGSRTELLSVFLGYNNWWQIARNADYFTRIANASPFTHLWFLAIELQYYLVWPLIFISYRALDRRGGKSSSLTYLGLLTGVTALIMPMAYHPGMDVTRLYYGTDARVYALLFGAFLGMVRTQKADEWRARAGKAPRLSTPAQLGCVAAFFGILAFSAVMYFRMDGQAAFTYRFGMLLMTALFGVLLIITADPRLKLGTWLENIGVLNWLGKRSYGIFLWQYPVIFFFNIKGLNFAGNFVIEIALTLALAAWSGVVTDILTNGKTSLGKRLVFQKIIAVFAVTALALVFSVAGVVGLVRYGGPKASDTGRLKRQLARNQAALKNQQTGTTSIVTSDQHGDYSKTGNTAKVSMTSVCAVGDSVLLDASQTISDAFDGKIYIDAKKSRHISDVTPILTALKQQSKLPQTIVLVVGTNGPLYEKDVSRILKIATADRSIFWVNTYGPSLSWTAENNQILSDLAKAHSNVTVVDWQSLAAKHPDYFYEDGIHPNPTGNKALTKLLTDTMRPIVRKQEKIDRADELSNPFAY